MRVSSASVCSPAVPRRVGLLPLWAGLTVLALAWLPSREAWARPVSARDAAAAVSAWLKLNPEPFGEKVGHEIDRVVRHVADEGMAQYYIVYLKPEGFVVVSGDDRVTPILGLVPKGKFDPKKATAWTTFAGPDVAALTKEAYKGDLSEAAVRAQAEWRELRGVVPLSAAPTTVYVQPMLTTSWGRRDVQGQHCYNYYTPNNLSDGYAWGAPRNFGGLACAMAQLMCYDERTLGRLTNLTVDTGLDFYVSVETVGTMLKHLRGGDGLGGPYKWADMIDDPASAQLTSAHCRAIGGLIHDAGVSIGTRYGAGWGSWDIFPNLEPEWSQASWAMKQVFGYSSAVYDYRRHASESIEWRPMAAASVDNKRPALLGLTDTRAVVTTGQREVGVDAVVDGYGCSGRTWENSQFYFHYNFGWEGADGGASGWWVTPSVGAGGGFNRVHAALYNIWEDGQYEVITGRATDGQFQPLERIQVTAIVDSLLPGSSANVGDQFTGETDELGVFCIKVPANAYYRLSPATVERPNTNYYFEFARDIGLYDPFTGGTVVTVTASVDGGSTAGNFWGLVITGTAFVELDLTAVTVPEGSYANVRMRLGAPPPAGTVDILQWIITGSDPDIRVNPSRYTFTDDDWDVYQAVTITAAEDGDTDNGLARFTFHDPDPDGSRLMFPSYFSVGLLCTEADNDLPTVLADPTEVTVFEGGAATFTVYLNVEPAGQVTVTVTLDPGSLNDPDIAVSATTSVLHFLPSNYDEPQVVTVTASLDGDSTDGTATMLCSGSGAGVPWGSSTVLVTEHDTDRLEIVTDTDTLSVPEGGMNAFYVTLFNEPVGTLTVSVFPLTPITDPDIAVSVTAQTLAFDATNWDIPRAVTVTAADEEAAGHQDAVNGWQIVACQSPGYNSANVLITEAETDQVLVTVPVFPNELVVPEGGSATFTIRLKAVPAGDVVVTVENVLGDPDLVITSDTQRTFTTDGSGVSNRWDEPWVVTVSALDDVDVESDTAHILCQPDVTGWSNTFVVTREADDDKVVLPNATNITVPEGGSTSLDVQLKGRPSGDVNVAVNLAGSPDIAIQSGALLFFSPSTWDLPQQVVLVAAEDVDDINGVATLTAQATNWETGTVTAQALDNDWKLTVVATPTNSGTVTRSPQGDVYASGFTYTKGTVVELTASAFDGFRFTHWDGAVPVGWTRSMGGTNKESATGVAHDSEGNIFICGFFEGTVDFDPTISVDNHSSVGNRDVFVTKLMPDGRYLWTRTWGGTNIDNVQDIEIDGSDAVFVVGEFRGTVQFAAGVNHTSNGDADVFMTKLANDGTHIYTLAWGGIEAESGRGLALDTTGSVYVTGSFRGTVDFDPTSGTLERTSLGEGDIFIAKLTNDGSTLRWIGAMGGSENDAGYAVATDPSGDIFVTGTFRGNVADLDPTLANVELHSAINAQDVFMNKVFSDGSHAWSRTFGGSSTDIAVAVAADSAGNAIAVGHFIDQVNFNPDGAQDIHVSQGNYDVFVTKRAGDGSYIYTRRLGGTFNDLATDVDVLGTEIAVAGSYGAQVDFDPTSGEDIHVGGGGKDIYISRLAGDGTYRWTRTYGGTLDEEGGAVAFDASTGNLVVAGYFEGTVDFDPVYGPYLFTSNGDWDIFATRLDAGGLYNDPAATSTANPLYMVLDRPREVQAHFFGGDRVIVVDTTAVTVPEGDIASFNVRLQDAPGTNVIVAVTTAGDSDISVTTGSTVVFTPANWQVLQAIGLAAAEDVDAANGVAQISLTAAGWTTVTVNATEQDDDWLLRIAVEATSPVTGTTSPAPGDYGFEDGVVASATAVAMPGSRFSHWSKDVPEGWVRILGGANAVEATDVARDLDGNVLVCGFFSGSVDFDPTSGTDSRASNGGRDAFVTKLSPAGLHLWTRVFGASGDDAALDLALDAAGGLYVAGEFSGTVIFDGVSDSRTAVGGTDVFVTRLGADGSYGWTRAIGGSENDAGLGLALDGSGFLYLVGAFRTTMDLDPSAGVDSVTSNGEEDVFVVKLSVAGDYAWGHAVGGTGVDMGQAVAADSLGQVVIVGEFENLVDFDPTGAVDNRSSLGGSDVFIVHMNADSSYGGAETIGGVQNETAYAVEFDALGSLLVAGAFSDSVDFDPSAGVDNQSSEGNTDVFVTKFLADGSYRWTRAIGGTGNDAARAIAFDSAGAAFVAGYFGATVEFGVTPGADTRVSNGGRDAFVTKLFSNGVPAGLTRAIGGTLDEEVAGVALDGSDNILLAGVFMDTVEFDPMLGGLSRTVVGQSDAFVVKLNSSGNYVSGSATSDDNPLLMVMDRARSVTAHFVAGDRMILTDVASVTVPEGQSNTFRVKLKDAIGADLTVLVAPGAGSDPDITVGAGATLTFTSSNWFAYQTVGLDAAEDDDVLDGVATITCSAPGWATTSVSAVEQEDDWRLTLVVDPDPSAGTTSPSPGDHGYDDATTATLTATPFDGYRFSHWSGDTPQGWTRTFGDQQDDAGHAVHVDASGNVYVVGTFQGTVDFDPTVGVDSRTAVGQSDVFVAKFNSDGTYAWTQAFGGGQVDAGLGVTVDAAGGVYVTGYFNGTVDFDPTAGIDSRTAQSVGASDVFLTKLNADATYGWTRAWGGNSDDVGQGVGVDSNGDIYVAGYFGSTVDFDPSAGTQFLSSLGGQDVFVSKLTSAGVFAWAARAGGALDDRGVRVRGDAAGTVVIVGEFQDTAVDFDPTSGVDRHDSQGGLDVFVMQLLADGSYGWTRTVGGTGDDAAVDVAVDSLNNLFVTGYFQALVDFDPTVGSDNTWSLGLEDIFVSKLLSDGSYGWTRTMGGASSDFGRGVAVDEQGNVYVTGSFQGTVDFDPSTPGSDPRTASGASDVFAVRLNADGSYAWARTMGITGANQALDMHAGGGYVVFAGEFEDSVDFDPTASADLHTSNGGFDAFVTRLNLEGSYSSPSVTTTVNPIKLVMDRDKAVTAHFASGATLRLLSTGGGFVDINGNLRPVPHSETFVPNTAVTLTVVPLPGIEFSGWGGAITGSASPVTLTMDSDKTAAVTFTAALTMTVSGSGTVTADPAGPKYVFNTVVSLTAVPDAGRVFDGWSGAVTGTAPAISLTMDAAKAITASFNPISYTVSLTVVPDGSGTVTRTPDLPAYLWGDVVTLTALPEPGMQFQAWSGDAVGVTPTVTVTIDGNKAVTATFVAVQYVITRTVSPDGGGLIVTDPPGPTYVYGTVVTLTATASPNFEFDSWLGDVSGANPTVVLLVDDHKAVTATFAALYNLTISSSAGGGEVRVNGVLQALPYSQTFLEGSSVSLQAVPNPGMGLARWSGDLSGYTNPTSITMNGHKSVIAQFTSLVDLDVILGGTGDGSIRVGADLHSLPYSVSFPATRVATLTAVPVAGSHFSGWGGDLSGSVSPIALTMDSAKQVVVNFTPNLEFTFVTEPAGLQVFVDGASRSTPYVAHWVPGIQYAVDVSSPQTIGTRRHVFEAWSDGGAQAHEITAPIKAGTFVVSFTTEFQVIASASPTAGGNINLSPSSPGNWYRVGSQVQLTALASAGWRFWYWDIVKVGQTKKNGFVLAVGKDPVMATAYFAQEMPDYGIKSVEAPAKARIGTPMTINYVLVNVGERSGYGVHTSFFASTDKTFDTWDVPLGSHFMSDPAPGQAALGTASITIGSGSLSPGKYLIFAKADCLPDFTGQVDELDEKNNVRAASGGTAVIAESINLTARVTRAPASGVSGGEMPVGYAVGQDGQEPQARVYNRLVLSVNQVIGDADDISLGTYFDGAVAGGCGVSCDRVVRVPSSTPAGAYYVGVSTDWYDYVHEVNGQGAPAEDDNVGLSADVVQIGLPVVDPLSVSVCCASSVVCGHPLSVGGVIGNRGTGSVGMYVDYRLRPLGDGMEVWLGRRYVGPVAAGGQVESPALLGVPWKAACGAYELVQEVDRLGQTDDSDRSNNVSVCRVEVLAASEGGLDRPVLVSPIGEVLSGPLQFVWRGVGGAASYEVWLCSGGGGITPLLVKRGVSGESLSSGVVVSDGEYEWWVRAVGEDGESWSLPGWFRPVYVSAAGLSTPEAVSPKGEVRAQPLELRWTSVAGASGYEVWLWSAGESVCPRYRGATDGSLTVTLPGPVPTGTYQWAVRAVSGGAGGEWCLPVQVIVK